LRWRLHGPESYPETRPWASTFPPSLVWRPNASSQRLTLARIVSASLVQTHVFGFRLCSFPSASIAWTHRAAPRDLEEVLSWEKDRAVQRNWTVACGGRWYQLDRRHEALSLAGRRAIVRRLGDGREPLVHRGEKLKWRALPGRPGGHS
jgi:hypothetical protein